MEIYTGPEPRSNDLAQKLLKQAGVWLRDLRQRRGLSQRELAARLGTEYYTIIFQLEAGRGRIPPDRYLIWAHALGIDKREFVRALIPYFGRPKAHRWPGPQRRLCAVLSLG